MKKTSLKNFVIFGSLLLISCVIVIKFNKIKRYIIEERYYERLANIGFIDHCFNATRDFITIMEQSGFDYYKLNDEVIKNSLAKFLNKDITIANKQPKIPAITHHIYFTYKQSPRAINKAVLKNLQTTLTNLNDASKEWQHYIWTNNSKVFPAELLTIKGVKLKDIAEFKQHPLYNVLLNIVNKASATSAYFARASDMFRLMVVQKFGGVYNDLDYEIYNANAMLDLMKRFDFIGGRENLGERSYYGNAFIAAKATHPVIDEAVKKLIDNEGDFSKSLIYTKYPCNIFDRVHFNGTLLLTMAYFSKNNLDGNIDIILPPWIIYNVEFARWKNGGCSYLYENRGDKLIEKFTKYGIINPHTNKAGIYYNANSRAEFPIIGADMFCASWYKYSN